MSKMRMPEMEVVRFKENDVIVASVYTLSNAGNGKPNDLTVTRVSDGKVFYNAVRGRSHVDYMSRFGGFGASFFYSAYNDPYTFSTLVENDDHGNPVSDVDGDYLWTGGSFHKQ